MPSPFPGMNPYLEQEDAWQDFHNDMISAIREALSPQVSPHFIVKIEEHLYIHELDAGQRIRVGSGLPVVLFERETYLEVRDRQSRELITVIEVLSPTNKKPGPDREQYLVKRGKVLRGAAHFVEIDLLRGWPRMPSEDAPTSDYCIMVSQVDERPQAAYWPVMLREPLPRIPIPLREPVPLAQLELQAVLHQVYDRAYYKDYIYHGQPTPALGAEDAAWAQSVLDRRTS